MTDPKITDPARTPGPLDEDTMNRLDQLLTRPDPPADSVTVHQLRRLVAGDLSDAEASEVRNAARDDAALTEQLRGLEEADAAFHAAHPFGSVKDQLFARAGAVSPAPEPGVLARLFSRRAVFWSLAAVATALVLGVLMPDPNAPVADVTDPDRPANRLKGATPLEAWIEVEGHPHRVDAGVALAAGDALQFKVTTTRSHLALLGVDGTGTVSRYVPVGGDVSEPFTPGTARPLSDALVLDDAPGPEVFVAFLSDEALLVEDLERALHDLLDAGGPSAVKDAERGDFGFDGELGIFFAEKVVR